MIIRHLFLAFVTGLLYANILFAGVIINEIRIDQTGTDNDEYFELKGVPGTSLDSLTYIVIGDGSASAGSGVIEAVVSLAGQSIDFTGYFLTAKSTFTLGTADLVATLNFENDDNVTNLLVKNFTGANNMDLDPDDNGVLDSLPWTEIVDKIALAKQDNPPTSTEYHYGPPLVGPRSVIGHVYRDRTTGTWLLGAFDPGDSDDTPKGPNLRTSTFIESKLADTTGTYSFCSGTVVLDFITLSGADSVQVEVFGDSFPPYLPTAGLPVKRFYRITPGSGITAFRAACGFLYLDDEFAASAITDERSLYCARYDGSAWQPYSSQADMDHNTVNCTTSVFSLWGIGGPGGALPIELAAFTAAYESNAVVLRWSTQTETDNLGWNILRSLRPDSAFTQINPALIPGAGTTTQPRNYFYADAGLADGTYYYQLEQVDTNGARKYSWLAAVQAGAAGIITFSGQTGSALQSNTPSLLVYDMQGRCVARTSGSFDRHPQQFAPGVYFTVTGNSAERRITKRLYIER
jgi:hypothetical protein